MKKQILFNLFFFAVIAVFAQNYSVSGHVSDENGESLLGVHVEVLEHNNGAVTDNQGAFALTLPKGKYRLEFSALGFKTKIHQIEVSKNIQLDVVMSTSAQTLEEVLVRGVRVDADSHITNSNLYEQDLAKRNLGQDLHIKMHLLHSLTTTSA